jgi:hypothetical protein
VSLEDFTTYTEVDPNNHLSKTASQLTIASLSRGENAYLYKDKGINHFGGNFDFLVDIKITSDAYYNDAFFLVLANAINETYALWAANESMLGIECYHNDIYLIEKDGSSGYDTYASRKTLAKNTTYYLKFKRDESVGTYGTLYLYVYTDPARTILVNTQSIALHGSKKDFRYIYAVDSGNDANTTLTVSGYIENLNLNE